MAMLKWRSCNMLYEQDQSKRLHDCYCWCNCSRNTITSHVYCKGHNRDVWKLTNWWYLPSFEIFFHYLKVLREHYGGVDGPKLHLILDVYQLHWTDDIKNFAFGLNINLFFVPAGKTDEFQPLILIEKLTKILFLSYI